MAVISSITIDDRLTPALRTVIAGVKDLSRPFQNIALKWLRNTQDRFDAQISPTGVPWEPSARSLREGGRTLYQHGFLYRALSDDYGADFAQVGVEETAAAAVYARIHNEGGVISAKKGKALKTPYGPFQSVTIPQRQFIGHAIEDLDDATEILSDHLQRLFDAGEGAAA